MVIPSWDSSDLPHLYRRSPTTQCIYFSSPRVYSFIILRIKLSNPWPLPNLFFRPEYTVELTRLMLCFHTASKFLCAFDRQHFLSIHRFQITRVIGIPTEHLNHPWYGACIWNIIRMNSFPYNNHPFDYANVIFKYFVLFDIAIDCQ